MKRTKFMIPIPGEEYGLMAYETYRVDPMPHWAGLPQTGRERWTKAAATVIVHAVKDYQKYQDKNKDKGQA